MLKWNKYLLISRKDVLPSSRRFLFMKTKKLQTHSPAQDFILPYHLCAWKWNTPKGKTHQYIFDLITATESTWEESAYLQVSNSVEFWLFCAAIIWEEC